MNVQINPEKFKDMPYEAAIGELNHLIGILERSEGTFDELMQIYREAFEYHAYCTQYLAVAAQKIKDFNASISDNQEGV